MKIIDILDKTAKGTLEDGFKFKYLGSVFTYTGKYFIDEHDSVLTDKHCTEDILTDEVEVIEDVKEIEEIKIKKNENGVNFITSSIGEKHFILNVGEKVIFDKINELVQAVNELRKEKSNDN